MVLPINVACSCVFAIVISFLFLVFNLTKAEGRNVFKAVRPTGRSPLRFTFYTQYFYLQFKWWHCILLDPSAVSPLFG